MTRLNVGLSLELGQRMCAAWGLDPTYVCAIDVRWRPNDLPTALVEIHLSEQAVYELLTLGVISREPAEAES